MAFVSFLGLLTGADLRPDTRDDTRFSGGWDGQYLLTENGRFTGVADFAYLNDWSDTVTAILFRTGDGVAAWQLLLIDEDTFFSLNAAPTQGPLLKTLLAGPDVINGSLFNDHLWGYGSSDLILGLRGNDVIVGGSGNDRLEGGVGIDTASWEDRAIGVTLALGVTGTGTAVLDNGEVDSIRGFENLTGGGGADVFTGNAMANTLLGLAGSDTLFGLGGDDRLFGGTGNDRLFGGAGADRLNGGAGNDTLSGGVGIDRFIFGADAAGNDVISDFTVSGAEPDRLVFSTEVFANRAEAVAALRMTSIGAGFYFDHGSVILAGLSLAQAKTAAMDFLA